MPPSNAFTGLEQLQDESIVLKDYVAGQRLGEGSYASVFLVTYVPSNEQFAMKIIPNTFFMGNECQIIQEATVMQSLEHPHVVKLYKFLQSTSAFYLVLELASGGELFDLIISKKYFSETTARMYFQQLMSAIDYCHSNGVAHRDLKAENLLLGKDNKLLVCDFGFCSRLHLEGDDSDDGEQSDTMLQPTGTLHYTSPEMAARSSSSASVNAFQQDLWSAGIILFFMLTGRLPFDGRDDEETLHFIQTGAFDFTNEECTRISREARALVTSMLAVEPTMRPSTAQIIEDRWFVVDLEASFFPHRVTLKRTFSFLDFSTQHRVTEQEEAALRTAFSKIDIDGYGKITRDQLRDMLTTLHGEKVSAEEVGELVKLFTGHEKSTVITYEQFRDAWVKKDLAHLSFKHSGDFQLSKIISTHKDDVERDVVRKLRRAFDSIDDLHTGVINVNQWKQLFKRNNCNVNDEELCSLMRFFDEHNQCKLGEITFDMFLDGVVHREMLVRHPMGRKLAAATNLAELLQTRRVTVSVLHGFIVCGIESAIIGKLQSQSDRLTLLFKGDTAPGTEQVYSFRYVSTIAAAMASSGCTGEGDASLFLSYEPMSNTSFGHGSCSSPFMLPRTVVGASVVYNGYADRQGSVPGESSDRRDTNGIGSSQNNNNSSLFGSSPYNTRGIPPLLYRAIASGGAGTTAQKGGVCNFDLILAQASLGYTVVRFRRIYGQTRDFHEAVAYVTDLLDVERQQAMEDTLPRGESVLI
ncbi:Protein kinase domain [Trypanosoma vivax]|uniref:Protein kinase n=1 Tax=Trypanosoma vivax (strain Y486) TaxID=1055687 RepID=G0U638_TRYVY|nr:putative protein kinase [Trypanosoma vivax]KAH8607989.1 Protein kinase domain [Trypanosoma vivax]CCC51340.1 putative protein kinase [Trypanosoma vivax Y486]